MSVVLEYIKLSTKLPCTPILPTSFPGSLSPRPQELLGAGRERPWERGCDITGWLESFALQNLQAFSKNEVTNVNLYTKHKSNFIVRICLYFIYEQI